MADRTRRGQTLKFNVHQDQNYEEYKFIRFSSFEMFLMKNIHAIISTTMRLIN